MFLENNRIKPTSVEQTLSSLATRGTKLRHIIFVIIESNMAVFAMQLVCLVLAIIPQSAVQFVPAFEAARDFTNAINQMINVIIIRSSVDFYFCFADKIHLV